MSRLCINILVLSLRSTTTSQQIGGMQVTEVGDETTLASQVPGGDLGTSSTTCQPRLQAALGTNTTKQIPHGEPHVELEDLKEGDPRVE
uniref:Uncharacterized protein n=1 Tax=Cannabis sativa TaxID=3483 RepID=A0A803PR01_CANSA